MDSYQINQSDKFTDRHIGPRPTQWDEMASQCGTATVDDLIQEVIPSHLLRRKTLKLPPPISEFSALSQLRSMAARNKVMRSMLGMGYFDCIVPPVIQRNILENPGWYTQYTPYQAEIAQGRLEALLNFQTMITEITGMDIANASLLDEATAAAEAMTLLFSRRTNKSATIFWVEESVLPQTWAVLLTRAEPLGITLEKGTLDALPDPSSAFGVLISSPGVDGQLVDLGEVLTHVRGMGLKSVVAADLLALTIIDPPGRHGADIVVGSSQRLGVPLGFGGPHAAFFAARDEYKRSLPGRIVGVSRDAQGRTAYRLALQTREQHIRREKATSNICTAQVLLAIMSSMFGVYHGPEGLVRIASRIHGVTSLFAHQLRRNNFSIVHQAFFDTVTISLQGHSLDSQTILSRALEAGFNLRTSDSDPQSVVVSFDQKSDLAEVNRLLEVFGCSVMSLEKANESVTGHIPGGLKRKGEFMMQPVFHSYRSETEMLRYIKKLETRDLSLAHSMIPLGSCTMKLNATSEMFPVSWPEWNSIHPFAPADQWDGYRMLFNDLENWLAEITGFDGVSLQPNAGSQGEYAGLLTIREYHKSRGDSHRNICLIPTSAHGTNPASAVMAGMKVVAVTCDAHGNINEEDLEAKAAQHSANLAALMITYPSTHGVFEDSIIRICDVIHRHGGQVYMDGANLNALVGLCSPADLGTDVCHINLHKTFCIPHGGGGPGMGPIAAASHLVPFLPGHPALKGDLDTGTPLGPVSAAPYSSASILVIPWMYIRMMGAEGLINATRLAILNANYIATRLSSQFPVLYKGKNNRVAHECILDLRQFKQVTVEDIAKRLMDYGFHAPTVSWPVPSTVMIEPTESESREELDRFIQAMTSIRNEIEDIESGKIEARLSPLKNAPHTADTVTADSWDRPYTRSVAAYPADWVRDHKFWPAVARIDNVYGDRNPICTCPSVEDLAHSETELAASAHS